MVAPKGVAKRSSHEVIGKYAAKHNLGDLDLQQLGKDVTDNQEAVKCYECGVSCDNDEVVKALGFEG